MISEDEKQHLVNSLRLAFAKFSEQHYRDIFANTRKKGSGTDAAMVEDYFLRVRANDIDSYMRVLGRRIQSKPVTKHRKILIEAAIRSVANGSFELSELGTNQGDNAGHIYTERQMRRIRKRYQNALFEPDANRKRSDDREKHLSTVFSDASLPSSSDGDAAHTYLSAAHKVIWSMQSDDMRRRLALISILRLAFPQFLEDMLEFRDECKSVFERLGKRNDRIDYLREQLVDDVGLLDLLYSHFTSILDVVWFRTLHEEKQELLLKPASKVEYRKNDAKRACRMLSDLYGQDLAYRMLINCGVAFQQFGMLRAASYVFAECANLTNNNMSIGTAWQNVATIHRIDQKYKLALGAMKKALPLFEATGDTYRICNALQLIGEFQWHLGHRDAAWKSFREVEGRGSEMDKDQQWKIPYNLGMTFGCLYEMRLRRKYLTRALQMILETDTSTILHVMSMINHERPVSPDDQLPLPLRAELDAAASEWYTTLYGSEDHDAQAMPDAAETDHAITRRGRNLEYDA